MSYRDPWSRSLRVKRTNHFLRIFPNCGRVLIELRSRLFSSVNISIYDFGHMIDIFEVRGHRSEGSGHSEVKLAKIQFRAVYVIELYILNNQACLGRGLCVKCL